MANSLLPQFGKLMSYHRNYKRRCKFKTTYVICTRYDNNYPDNISLRDTKNSKTKMTKVVTSKLEFLVMSQVYLHSGRDPVAAQRS